jgi:hypothetical protein
LILADEDDVADEDEEEEVANQDIDLFREIKGPDWNVQSHYHKAEHHLIDQDKIEDKVYSIHFKCENFKRPVMVFTKFILFLLFFITFSFTFALR